MEYHVLLSSDGFKNTYPSNTPYHFYADLCEDLKLDTRWKVALVDIVQNRDQDLYVYCNFTQECFVNNSKKSLLRYVKAKSDITRLYYHYVKNFRIHKQLEISIHLKDGSVPTFLHEPTIVILHFRRYPI
jgi:hypothetical protein